MAWSLIRPDSVSVWEDPEVRRRLDHYYSVMMGYRPAKYLVVKRVPCDEDPEDLEERELWGLHEKLSREFLKLYEEVLSGGKLEEHPIPEYSYLDVKIALVKRMLRSCKFCEWRCGADRSAGERGVCGLDATTRVATAFHHLGEEAPLVPSGTIFFTGCSFKCVFCQNWDISTDPYNGREVSPRGLARIAEKLYATGARNINYVGGNPDQQLHTIVESLRYMECNVPLLWNSNMYMTEESMRILADLIDIWLPDFKYGNDECALRLSGVKNYFSVVSRNHKAAHEHGDMIIRHLVLPNHVECCTRRVLEWIAENCPRALVNVMGQYRPEHLVLKHPEKYREIARRPSREEMERAFQIAEELGIEYKSVS